MIKAPDVTLLYVIFAFLIAYAILKKFLFGPLGGILEARETEEETATRVHAESLQRLSEAVAHTERELAQARREALKERETLRGEGRAHLEKKLEEASTAARSAIESAGRQLDEDAARASAEIPGKIERLARALVEKVLGRKLAA